MKYRWIDVLIVAIVAALFLNHELLADDIDSTAVPEEIYQNCVSIGLLQGGGALIGVDYERLLFDNIAIQVGMGLVGHGGALNIHFKPDLSASGISICYWNQGGTGETLSQRVAGITYLFRGKIGLTAQIGLGYVLELGEPMEEYYEEHDIENPPPVILLYSIGWTFKF